MCGRLAPNYPMLKNPDSALPGQVLHIPPKARAAQPARVGSEQTGADVRRQASTGLLLVLAVSGVAVAAGTPSVRATTDLTNQYYVVHGTTAKEMFASIRRQRLGEAIGRSASGLTKATLSSSAQIASSGSDFCRVESVELELTLEVTLPRHAAIDSLDPATRRQWRFYAETVREHEAEHVEIEKLGLREVQEMLERVLAAGELAAASNDCGHLVEEVLAHQRTVTSQRHDVFHRDEAGLVDSWRREARTEIAVVDEERAAYADDIAFFDDAIEGIRAERAALEQELSAIVTEFGVRVPEPAYSEAKVLEAASRKLVDEINGYIEERNALVADHRALGETRRRLVGELMWIR